MLFGCVECVLSGGPGKWWRDGPQGMGRFGEICRGKSDSFVTRMLPTGRSNCVLLFDRRFTIVCAALKFQSTSGYLCPNRECSVLVPTVSRVQIKMGVALCCVPGNLNGGTLVADTYKAYSANSVGGIFCW